MNDTRLPLTLEDIQALLRSMLRNLLLGQGKTQYLFAGGHELSGATSMNPETLDLTTGDLAVLADTLGTMLRLQAADISSLARGRTLRDWAQSALDSWRRQPRELVFMTSGSTGQPVPCPQSVLLLEQEILAQAEIHAARRRIIALVPRHHIYGFLFTLLLPKALNVPVLELPPVPTALFSTPLHQDDLIVAFPLFWKSLAALTRHLPAGLHGVTSTGPCPPDIIHTLVDLGLVRMTEVYGSSETGGLGYRHHPADAYTLFPFWRSDRQNSLVRIMPEGTPTGPFPLPDIVDWVDGRHFRPIRRTDRAVQVAGVNVYPDKVATILREHPLVQDCAVRLMRPEEGQRLKAFVVPVGATDTAALRRDLKTWATTRLSTQELPKSWTFGPSLPVTGLGKAADWQTEQDAQS